MRKTEKASNQEVLFSDFPNYMPRSRAEWLQRSKAAAVRRNNRLGQVASRRTMGFRRATGGLWVPAWQSENTAVIKSPEAKINHDVRAAKERVAAKYAESEQSSKRAKNAAKFLAMETAGHNRDLFRRYRMEARTLSANLVLGFTKPDKKYDRQSIEAQPLALDSICTYLMQLKAYAGAYDGDMEENADGRVPKRRWIRPNWERIIEAEKAEAKAYLDTKTTESFLMLTDEALCSHWSRERYWAEIDKEHKRYLKKINNSEPPAEVIPLEVYEQEGFI